jgi:hypothetical protein
MLDGARTRKTNAREIEMNHGIRLAAAMLALGTLAACDDTMQAETDTGLSGTSDQFDAMTGPCIEQASRMTGVFADAIEVTGRLQTGGGPLLTLSAAGDMYSCRLEDDGSVTVFSEFAN